MIRYVGKMIVFAAGGAVMGYAALRWVVDPWVNNAISRAVQGGAK